MKGLWLIYARSSLTVLYIMDKVWSFKEKQAFKRVTCLTLWSIFYAPVCKKNHNQTGGHVAPCVGSEATDTVVKQYSKTYYGSRPSDAHP